ncbi:hypothetical protein DL769_001923 [Monosporascus sp. CRB-8-3]|nr:hypothetical protein DL769_001923 [Monosporascus sp. CRB-8-3]
MTNILPHLNKDQFGNEIQVAAFVQGYYITAMNGSLFRAIKERQINLLEQKLGVKSIAGHGDFCGMDSSFIRNQREPDTAAPAQELPAPQISSRKQLFIRIPSRSAQQHRGRVQEQDPDLLLISVMHSSERLRTKTPATVGKPSGLYFPTPSIGKQIATNKRKLEKVESAETSGGTAAHRVRFKRREIHLSSQSSSFSQVSSFGSSASSAIARRTPVSAVSTKSSQTSAPSSSASSAMVPLTPVSAVGPQRRRRGRVRIVSIVKGKVYLRISDADEVEFAVDADGAVKVPPDTTCILENRLVMNATLHRNAVDKLMEEDENTAKELSQLKAESKKLGIQHVATLPELVLVDNQCAGKSSLMSGLTRLNLPRSGGVCKRSPIHIRMSSSNGPQWSCTAQVAILNPNRNHELYAPDEGAIAKETELTLAASQTEAQFSPNIVALEMKGSDLPDLSFYDLPGVFLSPDKEENDYLVKVVRNLTRFYIQRPEAIIIHGDGSGENCNDSEAARPYAQAAALNSKSHRSSHRGREPLKRVWRYMKANVPEITIENIPKKGVKQYFPALPVLMRLSQVRDIAWNKKFRGKRFNDKYAHNLVALVRVDWASVKLEAKPRRKVVEIFSAEDQLGFRGVMMQPSDELFDGLDEELLAQRLGCRPKSPAQLRRQHERKETEEL